jgi:hypothetical protein
LGIQCFYEHGVAEQIAWMNLGCNPIGHPDVGRFQRLRY